MCAVNALLAERSNHKIDDMNAAINLSIDGWVATTGVGSASPSMVFTAPRWDQADHMTLDSLHKPFDKTELPLGHVRVDISQEVWVLLAAVSEPITARLLEDRRYMSYNFVLALASFGAAQDFFYRVVQCIASVGKAMNCVWAPRLLIVLSVFVTVLSLVPARSMTQQLFRYVFALTILPASSMTVLRHFPVVTLGMQLLLT